MALGACDRSATKIDEFCDRLRHSTRYMSQELDNKTLQQGAGRELVSLSFRDSVAFCLDHKYDSDRADKCWIFEDYACLKAEADKIAAALDAR